MQDNTDPILTQPIQKSQILHVFSMFGYQPLSMVSRERMEAILQEQYRSRKQKLLHPELLQEIWNESETTSKGEISISTIADIVIEAQDILIDRIYRLTGPTGLIKTNEALLLDKKLQVKESTYAQGQGQDRGYFSSISKQYFNLEMQVKQNKADLKAFVQDYQALSTIFSGPVTPELPQSYTQYTIPKVATAASGTPTKSTHLLTLFHLCNLSLVLQLMVMSLRLSFLPLTSIMHAYYLLVQGFGAKQEVLYLIVHVLVGVLGDLVFFILALLNRYEIMPITYSGEPAFPIVLHILLVITMGIRVGIIGMCVVLAAGYKSNALYYFSLMGQDLPPRKPQQLLPSYGYYSQYSYNPQSKIYQAKAPTYRKSRQSSVGVERMQGKNQVSHVQKYEPNLDPILEMPHH